MHHDIHQRERRSPLHEMYGPVAVLMPIKLLISHGANGLMSTQDVSVAIRDGIENIRECPILDFDIDSYRHFDETEVPTSIDADYKAILFCQIAQNFCRCLAFFFDEMMDPNGQWCCDVGLRI